MKCFAGRVPSSTCRGCCSSSPEGIIGLTPARLAAAWRRGGAGGAAPLGHGSLPAEGHQGERRHSVLRRRADTSSSSRVSSTSRDLLCPAAKQGALGVLSLTCLRNKKTQPGSSSCHSRHFPESITDSAVEDRRKSTAGAKSAPPALSPLPPLLLQDVYGTTAGGSLEDRVGRRKFFSDRSGSGAAFKK